MSHEVNEQIKEQIMEEVTNMTVDEFQTAVEKELSGFSSSLDELVNALIQIRWENYPEGC
tara:strand:- start:513 stop:692 length:180 start_codon:yes stop_codon:yes gene_type:complete